MLVDLYENSFHIYLQSDKFRIADDRFDLDVEHPMSFFYQFVYLWSCALRTMSNILL